VVGTWIVCKLLKYEEFARIPMKYRIRNAASCTSCQNSWMDQGAFLRGIQLFNEAEFFEAHEVLEDVWRAAPATEKRFLQGLIQIAVAFHHHSTGNLVGARSLLVRGTRNLVGSPDDFGGIDISKLRRVLPAWHDAFADGGSEPPLPRMEPRGEQLPSADV